jgi:hypothetical protein
MEHLFIDRAVWLRLVVVMGAQNGVENGVVIEGGSFRRGKADRQGEPTLRPWSAGNSNRRNRSEARTIPYNDLKVDATSAQRNDCQGCCYRDVPSEPTGAQYLASVNS